jgi:hypothetical protein
MHRIKHPIGQPDELFTQNGPIQAMIEVVQKDYLGQQFSTPELPVTETSWRRVGQLPTSQERQKETIAPKRGCAVPPDQLACCFCAKVGPLVSNEWPTAKDGHWPIFGDRCPKCGGALEFVYVTS